MGRARILRCARGFDESEQAEREEGDGEHASEGRASECTYLLTLSLTINTFLPHRNPEAPDACTEPSEAPQQFSPTTPKIINAIHKSFALVIVSPNAVAPMMTLARVPTPDHVAYAMLSGSRFSASGKMEKHST